MSLRGLLSSHPIRILFLSFAFWKSLLLVVAATSPGPGYDTSASLTTPAQDQAGELPATLRHLIAKLKKWDAIYFVKSASRGYVFEQEWAFGWGFSRLIALCTAGIVKVGLPHQEGLEALVGIVIAHLAHLLSVLVLFALGITLYPSQPPAFALTAALLHILSPAGLFLSAPYAESSCALLSFSGLLIFAKSLTYSHGQSTVWHDLLIILSGISFGIATTFRSNGILNGLLLLEEAFRVIAAFRKGLRLTLIRRLLATGLGGLCVGAGYFLPQYIAWSEYCNDHTASLTSLRPWCYYSVPSIYSFVQGHYWNVGLFRYWTFSNIPLFLLATPMISLLMVSGIWALKHKTNDELRFSDLDSKGKKDKDGDSEGFPILRNLAMSQLFLTLLTLTTAHVQIITRISSAYPVWLWYLATQLREGRQLAGKVVRFMVIYGIVQGGLFASFLPPA